MTVTTSKGVQFGGGRDRLSVLEDQLANIHQRLDTLEEIVAADFDARENLRVAYEKALKDLSNG